MSERKPTWEGPFHRREIERGEYGQISKVEEERQEAYDALEQGQRLMLLVELADMVGAIEGVVAGEGGVRTLRLTGCNPAPAISRGDYDRRAAAGLRDVRRLLEEADTTPDRRTRHLAQAVAIIETLAAPHRLTFDDLERFAQLRSDVARHALQDH